MLDGMPPAMAARWANCACRRMRRSSLRWARATYRGLVPAILPFISVTARVASSAEEKATNADPRLAPEVSRMTRQEVMVPYSAKRSRSLASSVVSSRFLMYRLAPAIFSMRSRRSASNLALSSASRSAFFCARHTTHGFSSMVKPSSSSTALLAASVSSKHTKPKPLDLPSASFITTTEVSAPYFSNTSRNLSSSTLSCTFLTYTLLKVLGPPPRSPRRWKGPTYTCLSLSNMPFTLSMAVCAASDVSNCTKP
mmetsp:Transcript_4910/g.12468  ORF Transcript_4910/g.12468 Transcript_4910/m.12468 type:complete len:254 (-) Transcript_4910:713-1474(-)